MSDNDLTGKVTYDPRAIRQDTLDAMRGDIIVGLIEFITNSDDAYRKVKKSGKIDIEFKGLEKPFKYSITVRDHARGLSAAELKDKFLTIGKENTDNSGANRGEEGTRGLFGRGAKDVAVFGKVKFKTIHNNKFSYPFVHADSHIRTTDKIKIICPKHGEIEVQASVHLGGHDCRKCKDERLGSSKRKKQAEFINECKRKWGHPDSYYELVEYKGRAHPIILNCPTHGPVETGAKGHLSKGNGCKVCAGNEKKDREEIIRLSQKRHGELYDYSRVEGEINNVHEKITIVCRAHGPFRQKAIGHYNVGYGCPKCGIAKSGLDNIKAFLKDEQRAQSYCELYLVGVGEFIKIGIAEDTYERDKRFYDEYILILPSRRATCWVAEQCLLIQTAWMEPSSLPKRYSNWPGRSELRSRDLEMDELVTYMEEVLEEAETLGWLEFAKKHDLPDHGYGWDPESGI